MRSFVTAARTRFLTATTLASLALLAFASSAFAQISGTKNIPGDYATLALAIADLNTQGVGAGGVTFNVAAGYTETITAPLSVTATGTLANPIVFQKSGAGANPLVTAHVGTGTPGSANQDGVWRLVGSDFVTIDGIDLTDPNLTNPATMEYGYALYKASVTDGCQNVTIQNCTITLNRINNAGGTGPSVDGSRGIDVVNAIPTAATTSITVTAASGTNSNNRFYANTIQNCNVGISLIGFAAVSPFTLADTNNDVGGAAIATGNIIRNFGGGAATSPAAGIRTLAQYGLNLSFNTINNNDGAGVNHATTLRGIFNNTAVSASATINNNTVTVKSAATTSILEGIENVAGATAAGNTININNNTITNCTYTTATSGAFTGIVNSASAATVNINGNILSSNATNATSGTTNLIQNTGAATVAINMNSNTINGWTFNAATSGALNAITNTAGAATATLSMTGNDIRAITHSVTGSSAHTYLNNSGFTGSTNINSNTFTNLIVNTTGAVTFIANNVTHAAGTTHNVNNNSIVTAFSKTGAGGTILFYNSFSTSPATVTEINNGNNFSNMTFTGAATITGWRSADGPTGGTGSRKTATSNTFNNIVNGAGNIIILNVDFSDNTFASNNVTGNTVSNISGAANVTAITTSSGNQNYANNTISNLTSTGASGVVIGLSVTGGTTQNVTGNTINTLSGSGGTSPTATGILVSGGTTVNVSKNKVYDLAETGAIATAPAVVGINMTAGTTVNTSNNLVGDLRAPAASSALDAIVGLRVAGTAALTSYNLSFNTAWLNASSTGANFSTSGVSHATNATATTAALTMKDNVIVNTSTANGTGVATAYRRSSVTLTNYNTASNNNLFYGGVPSASRLIFFDGTNSDQLLSTYKTRVNPADGASVTENPPFLSMTGSSPNFLHIDPSIATQIESGGIPVGGITDDFDGNARNVTTPDIGADEGNFTLADFSGPTISYTPLANSTASLTRSFTGVTVTDPSGVNGTLGTRPRVYYKKSGDANTFVDNTNATNGWKYVEANGATSQFDFTIDYSLLLAGSVSVGDVVQYFVDAQDLAGTPNVSINSGIFATQPASVNLLAANFPITGTIRSYTIVDVPLNGDYTVGLTLFNQVNGSNVSFERKVRTVTKEVLEPADLLPQVQGDKSKAGAIQPDQLSWKMVTREVEEVAWVPMSNGQEFKGPLYVKRSEKADIPPVVQAGIYATITAAVADLNARGVSGPVRFLLLDTTYPTETLPITVNVLSASVPTAANPVAIKPSTGVIASVSGAVASNPIFKIFNTNFITIDGSNTLAGTTRDLTIENTSTTSPSVVWFGSSGTTPITGGALKNCIVRDGVNTGFAVAISDGAVLTNAGFFSNMEVRNNKIEKALIGVFAHGGTVPQNGSNLTYADNEVNTAGANAIRNVGLYIQGVNGATVTGNTVANLEAATGENDAGIWLASGTINGTVSGNTVSNLNFTGTTAFAPVGINVTPVVAASNNVVRQNNVSGMLSGGSSSLPVVAGISVTSASGGITIEKNNVQNIGDSNGESWPAVGINVNGGDNITVRNNFVARVFNSQAAGTGAFTPQFGATGIRVNAGIGHKVQFNSVHMNGAMAGVLSTNMVSALAVFATASTGCDIRDNILSNQMTGGNAAGTRFVAINLPPGGASAMNLALNNNAYYEGTSPQARMAVVGITFGSGDFTAANFNPGATTPATNFRSYSSTLSAGGTNDNASIGTSAAHPFTSDTDLHIPLSTLPPISNAGVSIAGVTDDIDGDLRTATPDIGADEFTNYTLTTSVTGIGSVTATPSQPAYAPGAVVSLTAVPGPCQEFTGWSGDASGNTNPLSVTMNSNLNIVANFALTNYTIAATTGPGGTISPVGSVSVACGSDQSFTITPNACFNILDVLVDNVSVGAVPTYTFTNVQAAHTIAATFVSNGQTYTITASAGPGGSISPTGAVVVACGANQSFTITPNACFNVLDVVVDDVSVGAVTNYTFTDVQATHTISATFVSNGVNYTITATAGPGGTISPVGSVSVPCGTDQSFTITPNACNVILDVVVDDVSVGAVTNYTFTNVQATHTIAATFVSNGQTYTITAMAGPGGTISPIGAVVVACGANQSFTITPNACFNVLDVLVDDVSVGAVTNYTFTNVQATHTIAATFVSNGATYTITASAGTGGSISPNGAVVVACGANQTFNFTAESCYSIGDVLVDDVSVGSPASYTFTNVTAAHTISVSFVSDGPPSVTVISPNGAETLIIGSNFALDWLATDNVGVTCVDLYLSRSGPSGPWETIATCVPNSPPYNWLATGPQTTTAYFRVDAHDAAGCVGQDQSNAEFEIKDLVTATVVALFQANPVNDGVRVEWRISDTHLLPQARVQRSEVETGPFMPVDATPETENGNVVVLDRAVLPGRDYFYRLEATTNSGQTVHMGTVMATAGVPIEKFAIERVGPNPTSGSAVIGFAIPRQAPIRLSVYDAQGREVAVLANGQYAPGRYSVTWSGEGRSGRLSAGMYFVRFQTPELLQTRRLVLKR